MPRHSGPPLAARSLRLAESLLFCPSCTQRLFSNLPRLPTISARRRISSQNSRPPSFVSSSAVNATKNIPDRFAELYKTLTGLRDAAASHVNASRLQLALRGLETETPVIRVAVLGLDGAATASRLVRLLLADPLSPKAEWEDYLEKNGVNSDAGLLIKYSERTEIGVGSPLVPTISIPAPILKKANLHIYVSSLGTGSAEMTGGLSPSTLYVPIIPIRSTSTGAVSPIRCPVHKVIICGKGVDALILYNKLIGSGNMIASESCRAVFDLNMRKIPESPRLGRGVISFVDMERADVAVAKFRESVHHASEYERGWTGSGLQTLLDWVSSTDYGDQPIQPDVKRLVESVLETTEESVVTQEKRTALEQKAQTVDDKVRRSLADTVPVWSERAHTELRDTLNEGFTSKRWRDLSWWQLFWHVDDLSMVMTDILEKKWLPHAEKEAIWLSGRIQQAGLLEGDEAMSNFHPAEPSAHPSSTSPPGVWTAHIRLHRDQLLDKRMPSLHALAQRLVAFTLSTTSLTSALAALTYISVSGLSAYEASTVAAVGLIYSLRRQQSRWDAAREAWESEVREQGRKALKETEDAFRTIIREGGRRRGSVTETEARTKIEDARRALADVK